MPFGPDARPNAETFKEREPRSARHYSRFDRIAEGALTLGSAAEGKRDGGRFRGFGSGAVTMDRRGWRGAVATMPTCQTSLRVK